MGKHQNVRAAYYPLLVFRCLRCLCLDPYPFAIDEAFDAYVVLVQSGRIPSLDYWQFIYIFCSRYIDWDVWNEATHYHVRGFCVRFIRPVNRRLLTIDRDSGATLAINVILKILEGKDSGSGIRLPQPVAVVLNYAALDFNFTSWMNAENLKVLREEQGKGGADLLEVVAGKDHFDHVVSLLYPIEL